MKLFVDTLFPDGGCYQFGAVNAPPQPVTDQITANYFCLNPLMDATMRRETTIAHARNFLFESDVHTLAEQELAVSILQSTYSPTSVVYSGAKSYHIIYSYHNGPKLTKVQYTQMRTLIQYKMNEQLRREKLHIKYDDSVRDMCRLSRSPGVLRNGVEQRLVLLADAHDWSDLTTAEQNRVLSTPTPVLAQTHTGLSTAQIHTILKNNKQLQPLADFLYKPATWMRDAGNHGQLYRNLHWLCDVMGCNEQQMFDLTSDVRALADKRGYTSGKVIRAIKQVWRQRQERARK